MNNQSFFRLPLVFAFCISCVNLVLNVSINYWIVQPDDFEYWLNDMSFFQLVYFGIDFLFYLFLTAVFCTKFTISQHNSKNTLLIISTALIFGIIYQLVL